MRGNSHVRFLGGGTVVTPSCYPGRRRMPDLPTGTVTLLFTDIEGRTPPWEHPARTVAPPRASATPVKMKPSVPLP